MDKEEQVYRDLQKHLDTLPVGFPATGSGVEIRILKHCFTPQEAEIAARLSITPEPASRIYERIRDTGITMEELQSVLDSLERKVLITTSAEGGEKLYRSSQFVVGIYESLVDHLTPEFMRDMGQYSQEAFGREMYRVKVPQVRTVPVEKSIPLPEKYLVGSYDSVRELVENNSGRLAVANCICRQASDLMGAPCTVSDIRETCLILDGEQYINAGLGRPITKEEAFAVLEKAREAGFVLQPLNSQRPEAICCCCGDCCGILRAVKRFPRPADYYASNFYAEIDPSLCNGCQTCVERCQLDAPYMSGDVAVINLDRCIGCGNCVVTCEAGAVRLMKKSEETVPPEDIHALLDKIADAKKEGS